jgi:hypothetical protein
MTLDLMQHQVTGVEFLSSRSVALLLDEAGTGKTAQVVRAAQKRGFRRVLVLCPAGVRLAWESEIEKWWVGSPPAVAVVTGGDGPYLPAGVPGWHIASHATLSSAAAEKLWIGAGGNLRWDLIVIDEASEFRRYEAKRTCNLLGDNGLWEFADNVWLLDGDPVVNSSMDLYPVCYGPLRRYLGAPPSGWAFGERYSTWVADQTGWRPIGVKNEHELADRLRPFVLRRTLASAGINLPPLETFLHTVALPPEAMALAEQNLAFWRTAAGQAKLVDLLENSDETHDPGLSRARHVMGVAKVPAVAVQILMLKAQRALPVVVFFQHTAVRDGLLKALVGLRLGYIDGTIAKKSDYNATKDLFQAGGLDVLLVQIQSGGRGLTLTFGCRVIIAEMPWTAVALWQAIKRVHRMTQKRPVTADIMVADHWLDQHMASTVRQKDANAKKLMDLWTT